MGFVDANEMFFAFSIFYEKGICGISLYYEETK